MYTKKIKRLIDLMVSLVGLMILSPAILGVLIFLTISNHGNPLFFQERPGRNNKIFKLIKFKTMNDKKDKFGKLLADHNRLTPIGRFIRASSLDELPQLINIIKGDMSLIGPRPLLIKYLPLFTLEQSRRHQVRPGLTGWAQVNGRNTISWEQKFELDVWYVDSVSFALHCKIIWKTLINVIRRKGINASDNTTMESFKGSSG